MRPKFKTYVEALDRPYRFEVSSTASGLKQYGFETEDGIYYVVTLSRKTGYKFDSILIMFETEDGELITTGTGDAFRVLATVSAILKKEKNFLKDADILYFEADIGDRGRQKLYNRLNKMLAKEVNKKAFDMKNGINRLYIIAEDPAEAAKYLLSLLRY